MILCNWFIDSDSKRTSLLCFMSRNYDFSTNPLSSQSAVLCRHALSLTAVFLVFDDKSLYNFNLLLIIPIELWRYV